MGMFLIQALVDEAEWVRDSKGTGSYDGWSSGGTCRMNSADRDEEHRRSHLRHEWHAHLRAPFQRRHLRHLEGLGPRRLANHQRQKPVLLDFSKVEHINSSGIALIIQVLMEADKTGRKAAPSD
jgi:ABC-type transporter Mla MlaB component